MPWSPFSPCPDHFGAGTFGKCFQLFQELSKPRRHSLTNNWWDGDWQFHQDTIEKHKKHNDKNQLEVHLSAHPFSSELLSNDVVETGAVVLLSNRVVGKIMQNLKGLVEGTNVYGCQSCKLNVKKRMTAWVTRVFDPPCSAVDIDCVHGLKPWNCTIMTQIYPNFI